MSKFGRKLFVLDENRRNTYRLSQELLTGRGLSILNTFDGEKKQLMAVRVCKQNYKSYGIFFFNVFDLIYI